MRRLPVFIMVFAFLGLLWSCREERHSFVANMTPEVPTMTTTDVSTFISDSGYTRYHITTDIWQMFEDVREPYWKFPVGLRLEQYNEQLQPSGNMICDSARYLERQRLWKLDGNVVMVNVMRDSFYTQQLFWDQMHRRVYSDSFIHIVKGDRVIEGYGFESDQNMTSYSVNRPTAIFPINRPEGQPADVGPVDTNAVYYDSTGYQIDEPQRLRRAPVRASERNQYDL